MHLMVALEVATVMAVVVSAQQATLSSGILKLSRLACSSHRCGGLSSSNCGGCGLVGRTSLQGHELAAPVTVATVAVTVAGLVPDLVVVVTMGNCRGAVSKGDCQLVHLAFGLICSHRKVRFHML
jgi:hypothetical protein